MAVVNWALGITVFVVVFCVFSVPIYVIARRSNLKHAWITFLPILGCWIVLFEVIGRSGWLSLLAFVPYAGPLVISIWTSVELPVRHGRSRWWTLALVVPFVNAVGYWWYAFTLRRAEQQLSFT